jgi:hypothetical protein
MVAPQSKRVRSKDRARFGFDEIRLAIESCFGYHSTMTDAERALTKRWVDTWAQAAPELQKVRDADIRASDTASMIECCTSLFRDALKNHPPKPTTGLIEQQTWFMKMQRT